jgi:CheY-like chemotaxis protein
LKKRVSILVVDEKKIWQNLLAAVFSRAGWETRSAHTCFEALKELRSRPADCLVAEYRLPDGRAGRIREEMSADPSVRPCPMVVLSADALDEPEAVRECGADAFAVKGTGLPELVGIIKRLTGTRQPLRPPRKPRP